MDNNISEHKLIHPIFLSTNNNLIMAVLGDSHYGKVTATFNADKLKEALANYRDYLSSLIDVYPNKPDMLFILLGDMVDGQNIFPQQVFETSPQDPIQQSSELANMLDETFFPLKSKANFIGFIPVIGNHGRVSKFHPVTTSVAEHHDPQGILKDTYACT